MGNIFSRRVSIKSRLLDLESEILKYSYELDTMKRTSPLRPTIIISLMIMPLAAYVVYVLGAGSVLIPVLLVVTFLLLYFLLDFVRSKRISSKEKRLNSMKIERKELIERCKNDIDFSVTKSLIEKYEDEESRASFFSQIQKKKRSHFDSATDFILGSDPSNLNALICKRCGVHNGLVDPKNEDIEVFYCYNCREKNIRKQRFSDSASPNSHPSASG